LAGQRRLNPVGAAPVCSLATNGTSTNISDDHVLP
jgi:hypothetical protein